MGGLWVLVGSRGAFQLDMRLSPLKLSRSCACKSIRQQISIECPCAHGLAGRARLVQSYFSPSPRLGREGFSRRCMYFRGLGSCPRPTFPGVGVGVPSRLSPLLPVFCSTPTPHLPEGLTLHVSLLSLP